MKKKIALIFILIFVFSTCAFLLASCNDGEKVISDFERNHGERYLKEYTYYETALYEYDEEDEKYWPVYTWWNEDSLTASTDDLRGYDYLINYEDGDYANEKWNAIFLQGKEFVQELGRSIKVSLNDMSFSGTLEAIPLDFNDMRIPGHAYINLVLTGETYQNLFIASDSISITYTRPTAKNDGSFILSFWTKPTVIAGKKYQMNFNYWADLAPGDTEW